MQGNIVRSICQYKLYSSVRLTRCCQLLGSQDVRTYICTYLVYTVISLVSFYGHKLHDVMFKFSNMSSLFLSFGFRTDIIFLFRKAYDLYYSETSLQWSPTCMGHKSMAVIERWLFNRGSNIGHYITSDLKQVAVIMRWLLYRVTTIQRFHCTMEFEGNYWSNYIWISTLHCTICRTTEGGK